jgi:hypothetical protein
VQTPRSHDFLDALANFSIGLRTLHCISLRRSLRSWFPNLRETQRRCEALLHPTDDPAQGLPVEDNSRVFAIYGRLDAREASARSVYSDVITVALTFSWRDIRS